MEKGRHLCLGRSLVLLDLSGRKANKAHGLHNSKEAGKERRLRRSSLLQATVIIEAQRMGSQQSHKFKLKKDWIWTSGIWTGRKGIYCFVLSGCRGFTVCIVKGTISRVEGLRFRRAAARLRFPRVWGV